MAKDFKTGGRLKGTPNKITRAFREAVQVAYDSIGGDAAFAAWARENPTEFYKIAARLIPHQVNIDDRGPPVLNFVFAGEDPHRAIELQPTRPALNPF